MVVDVYIPRLNKYIMQDAFLNVMVAYRTELLNSIELSAQIKGDKQDIKIWGYKGADGCGEAEKIDRDKYFDYFGLLYSVNSGSTRIYPRVKKDVL